MLGVSILFSCVCFHFLDKPLLRETENFSLFWFTQPTKKKIACITIALKTLACMAAQFFIYKSFYCKLPFSALPLVIRASGRVIMQVGKREKLSDCCWAVNLSKSMIPSLTVCPQNKSSRNICLNVPIAFTSYSPVSVSLCGLLLSLYKSMTMYSLPPVWTERTQRMNYLKDFTLPEGWPDAKDSHIATSHLKISHFSLRNMSLEKLIQK